MLTAILPDHEGPTEVVPVDVGTPDEGSTGGIESRSAVTASLNAAQEALARHHFDRILTLGGGCSVSVAPFAALAHKYADDLAVVWIDAHPEADTSETGYGGYHAMAARRCSVTVISTQADVVGHTIAEFISRETVALQGMLRDLPLIGE